MTISENRLVEPALHRASGAVFAFDGWIGERIRANEKNWLIPAPAANPGMVEMFAHRDSLTFVNGNVDSGDPLPWAGEFAGKYLISAVQSLRLTGNANLTTWCAIGDLGCSG